MKFRFSLSQKIVLPYLVIAGLFGIIFLSEFEQGHGPVIWLSITGMAASIVRSIEAIAKEKGHYQQI